MHNFILNANAIVDANASFSLNSDIIIPAFVALLVSGLTLLVTYLTTDRRAKFDAAFEASKYREKWLSDVREEIVEFCTLSTTLSLGKENRSSSYHDLLARRIRLKLSIPRSNPSYDSFDEKLDELYQHALGDVENKKAYNLKPIIKIADDILEAEWDSIQQLLATGIKKDKKKNA